MQVSKQYSAESQLRKALLIWMDGNQRQQRSKGKKELHAGCVAALVIAP